MQGRRRFYATIDDTQVLCHYSSYAIADQSFSLTSTTTDNRDLKNKAKQLVPRWSDKKQG